MWLKHVKTIINHPPVITIIKKIGGKNHSQNWVVDGIVLTTSMVNVPTNQRQPITGPRGPAPVCLLGHLGAQAFECVHGSEERALGEHLVAKKYTKQSQIFADSDPQ